jgi:mono/diheme cytochrome c family protein
MTNAQKWITGFLLLFLILFFLNQLTKKEYDSDENGYASSTQTVEKSGEELFQSVGCVSCHGSDMKGTPSGPDLYSAKTYWSRDNLINYLRNPASFGGDKRFEAYRVKSPGKMMPGFAQIDVKELGKIADFILNLK